MLRELKPDDGENKDRDEPGVRIEVDEGRSISFRYRSTNAYPRAEIFARFRVGGKIVRSSTNTDSKTTAKLRLPDIKAEERKKTNRQTRRSPMSKRSAMRLTCWSGASTTP